MKQFNPNKDYKCKVCKGGFKKRNSLDVFCSVKCRVEHEQKIRSKKLRSGILKCHKPISFVSAKNTFRTSDGERLTKFEINKRIKSAKDKYTEIARKKAGIIICERCKDKSCWPIQRSHIISVNEAQNSGRAELCWDINNLEHLGQPCHSKFEDLPKEQREKYYHDRKARIDLRD